MLQHLNLKKVLIVDYDYTRLDYYWETLSREVYAVITSEFGNDAYGKLRKMSYDLVITEIAPPAYFGIAFFINAIERYPHLLSRFIFVCTPVSQDVCTILGQMGSFGMERPFTKEDLIERAGFIIGYNEDMKKRTA